MITFLLIHYNILLKKILDFVYNYFGDTMIWKYIITFVLILIGFSILKSFNIYNRFKFYNIKLDKANEKLKEALLKKYDLLLKQIKLFKGKKKLKEDEYKDFIELDKNINVSTLDNEIDKYSKKLEELLEKNNKLIKDAKIKRNTNDIEKIDVTIRGLKKYYNNTVDNYNKRVHKFPSNIIAKMYKYKDKDKYSEEENKLKVFDKLNEEIKKDAE